LVDKLLWNKLSDSRELRWLMYNPHLSKHQYLDLLAFAGPSDDFWRANFMRNEGLPEEILSERATTDESPLVRGAIAKYSHAREETRVIAALMGTRDFEDYLQECPKGHPDVRFSDFTDFLMNTSGKHLFDESERTWLTFFNWDDSMYRIKLNY
jgi:hypothetical protein